MNPAFVNVERQLSEGGLGTGKGGYWKVSEDVSVFRLNTVDAPLDDDVSPRTRQEAPFGAARGRSHRCGPPQPNGSSHR